MCPASLHIFFNLEPFVFTFKWRLIRWHQMTPIPSRPLNLPVLGLFSIVPLDKLCISGALFIFYFPLHPPTSIRLDTITRPLDHSSHLMTFQPFLWSLSYLISLLAFVLPHFTSLSNLSSSLSSFWFILPLRLSVSCLSSRENTATLQSRMNLIFWYISECYRILLNWSAKTSTLNQSSKIVSVALTILEYFPLLSS